MLFSLVHLMINTPNVYFNLQPYITVAHMTHNNTFRV